MLAETEMAGDGRKGRLYLTLRCHHQNDLCIKTGSDESHFNVLLITRDSPQQMNLSRHVALEFPSGD